MDYQEKKWQTYLMFPNGQSANGNGKHLILYEIIMKGNKIMNEKTLDYETAYRAVHGDHDAQMKVLAYYDSYINALATREKVTDDGSMIRYIDEDLKAKIQAGYLEALPKCKAMR